MWVRLTAMTSWKVMEGFPGLQEPLLPQLPMSHCWMGGFWVPHWWL
jgi:hypothetical protein